MIETARKIGLWNAFFMLLLSIALYTHVLLIPTLVIKAGRDSWLGLLIATAVMFFWNGMFAWISKRLDREPIPLWISQRLGTGMRYLITAPIALCIFVMNWVTFKDTISWSHAAYMPYTPSVILALLLALICFWACSVGIRNIAFTAGILGPLVCLCGFFIMSANMPKKHYSMLLPFLEHGMTPVWQCTWDVLGGWMEIFMVLLLQRYIAPKVKINFLNLSIFNLVIMAITMGPLVGAVSEFGIQEAISQRYPAFEQWRLVQIGKYIEHTDFLSIYQWLSGAFIRISLLGFITMDLFMIREKKQRGIFLAVLFLLLVSLTMLPISDLTFFNLVLKYYTPLVLSVFFGATVILFLLSILPSRLERQS